MCTVLDLQAGAAGFQLSNPPVMECLSLKASLDVFADTSMRELTTKSRILTGYLEMLIEHYLTKEKRENVAGVYFLCNMTVIPKFNFNIKCNVHAYSGLFKIYDHSDPL